MTTRIPAAISGSHQSDRLVGHPQLTSALHGLGGDDVLIGSRHADTLIGGPGRDTLTGGAGADLFVLEGIDRITDFEPDEGEVVEGPTDEELWDIGERHLWTGTDESVTNYRILTSFIEAARVVLARYGHQPAPPAEGEVAELTRWLRMQGEAQKPGPNSLLSDRTKKEHHAAGVKLTRAADLLEQRHPEPVPPAGSGKPSTPAARCWGLDRHHHHPRRANEQHHGH